MIYKLVVFLWVIYLFDPARLIAYYVPALTPLLWIRELLLYGTLILLFLTPKPKKNMKWFMAFVGLTIFGTVIAFATGNWGVARKIVRQIFQYYVLGLLTINVLDTPERTGQLLRLYLFSFFYYAVWGLFSLKVAPLTGDIDPSARKLVYWHIHFDNRDGFGPLMVMGFVYAFYLNRAMLKKMWKLFAGATSLLCFAGIIISFGRGVFVSFVIAAAHILLKTKRKLVTAVVFLVIAVVFFSAFPNIAQRYWDTMKTITAEGTTSGTGLDRKILWGWAWREFLSSPVYGVGTGNFGIALVEMVDYDEGISAGYTPGMLYGRSLHCAPMTVLCEYGIIGAIIVLLLIVDVFSKNRQIRKNSVRFFNPDRKGDLEDEFFHEPSALTIVSNGLHATLITIIVSAFFYELLYTPLLWQLIAINYLVYVVSKKYRRPVEYDIT